MYLFKKSIVRVSLVWYLIISLFIITSLPSDTLAMFLPSGFNLDNKGLALNRSEDIKRIQSFLEKKIISQRLADLGLTKEEISNRLIRLSDLQIHQIATQIDTLYPGGDDALGLLITLLIITILVVILLQITGHKVIITK